MKNTKQLTLIKKIMLIYLPLSSAIPLLGAILIEEIMQIAPCQLCIYQRYGYVLSIAIALQSLVLNAFMTFRNPRAPVYFSIIAQSLCIMSSGIISILQLLGNLGILTHSLCVNQTQYKGVSDFLEQIWENDIPLCANDLITNTLATSNLVYVMLVMICLALSIKRSCKINSD